MSTNQRPRYLHYASPHNFFLQYQMSETQSYWFRVPVLTIKCVSTRLSCLSLLHTIPSPWPASWLSVRKASNKYLDVKKKFKNVVQCSLYSTVNGKYLEPLKVFDASDIFSLLHPPVSAGQVSAQFYIPTFRVPSVSLCPSLSSLQISATPVQVSEL